MKVTYFLNLSNSIDKMMMRTFLQCVQYLRLTSGPKRKNEYNNFCFLHGVELVEKMLSLAPGPALIPGL